MRSTMQFRVRYQETDQMGIVHHSVYFIWFEMGRTELMRERNLSYRECETRGWLLPLVESGAQYINPARYDDLIELETEMVLDKGAAFVFNYVVRNAVDHQILAKGFTKHVCVNREFKIDKQATKELKELFQL
ncbi:MAG TPA: thioesterase family protein [Bacillota bacterium]|jgi:acyl-CoA thioester hydrolase|nr:thioesterase family protein [Bacillota bacterium]HOL10578.1 thioesterase family protein [Bacillota bacterium]HPO98280.1 thioesterase family protein [Bacillota bacterium]